MTTGFTFLELAREALNLAPTPMAARELWSFAEQNGLTAKLPTAGKTPWHSLGALMYADTKENPASDFIRLGRQPVRFWLRARPLPQGWSPAGPGENVKAVPVTVESRVYLYTVMVHRSLGDRFACGLSTLAGSAVQNFSPSSPDHKQRSARPSGSTAHPCGHTLSTRRPCSLHR
jgi:hypothetical protein